MTDPKADYLRILKSKYAYPNFPKPGVFFCNVTELLKEDGTSVGRIKSIQKEKESKTEAKVGDEVAISLDDPIIGRHIFEEDVFYTAVPLKHSLALLVQARYLADLVLELVAFLPRHLPPSQFLLVVRRLVPSVGARSRS